MGRDDTTAGLMKRLIEAGADKVDWTKARAILNVATHEEAAALVASALVAAREELRRVNAHMALIIRSHSEQVVLMLDIYGRVVSVSKKGAALLGWPAEALLGRSVDVLFQDRAGSPVITAAEMARADRGNAVSSERTHRRSDGSIFEAEHLILALTGEGGIVTGFSRRIEDLTQRHAHELQIEELEATIALLVG